MPRVIIELDDLNRSHSKVSSVRTCKSQCGWIAVWRRCRGGGRRAQKSESIRRRCSKQEEVTGGVDISIHKEPKRFTMCTIAYHPRRCSEWFYIHSYSECGPRNEFKAQQLPVCAHSHVTPSLICGSLSLSNNLMPLCDCDFIFSAIRP